MSCARLSYQAFLAEDAAGLRFTVWGHFFEKTYGEPPLLPASTSPSLRRALFGSGALGPYSIASRDSGPFGSHITSVMTLVARGC